MRDLETIELALVAASTGHLVFGTLHTPSAAKTVDRIIDVFPAEQQNKIRATLSEALKGVVAQNLFKRIDKKGRVAALEILVFTTAIANLVREGKTHQIPGMIQVGKKLGNQPAGRLDHGASAHETHFARGSLRQVLRQEEIPGFPRSPARRRRQPITHATYAPTRTGLLADHDAGFPAGGLRPAVHGGQAAAGGILWRADARHAAIRPSRS